MSYEEFKTNTLLGYTAGIAMCRALVTTQLKTLEKYTSGKARETRRALEALRDSIDRTTMMATKDNIREVLEIGKEEMKAVIYEESS